MTRHGQRGQVMVEFACASLFALILIFGLVDAGRAVFTYDLVGNSARVGARYAMVRGSSCTVGSCPATPSSIATFVTSKSPGFVPNLISVATTWGPTGCGAKGTNDPGCVVTVQVSYPFKFLFLTFLKPINMTSSSSIVIEQ